MVEAADHDFYLPDDCWERVFKFIIKHDRDEDNNHSRYFESLSVVSKQFLSITNRLRDSLTIKLLTCPFIPSLFHRFPNLTSLNLSGHCLDNLLCQISTFSLNLTSLHLSVDTIPTDGLRAFSQNITTLTSFTCSDTVYLHTTDMFLIAHCFPNLKLLDLNNCNKLSEEGIAHVLRKCGNIRHLNLDNCIGLKLSKIKFEVPKLRVLNLSYTNVDDERLYVISKSCSGLLKVLLNNCYYVTKKGVKHVAENCTKLREISLRGCYGVDADVVASIVSSRPSLRKITAPSFSLI